MLEAAPTPGLGAGVGPPLGFGLGLRHQHFDYILTHWPEVAWFEAISENFMDSAGWPRQVLHRVAERYPVVLHGVSLSIGSQDPLNEGYLKRLRALADEVQAAWVSDHLCWTGVAGINSHDLLPLPLNAEVLAHVVARVHRVQEALGRALVLENPSTYLRFRHSDIPEPEFLSALCQATGCQLLLDVNNVYVSAFNAGFDARAYLDALPWERVAQIHLAGHQHCGTHIVDTHDRPVQDPVWPLFAQAWAQSNGASTLLEWDGDVPSFERLQTELARAQACAQGHWPSPLAEGGLDAQDPVVHGAAPSSPLSTPIGFLMPPVMPRSTVHIEAQA